MLTTLIEFLKDSTVTKILLVAGILFLLFAALGQVWGLKTPISRLSRFSLLFIGALILTGAITGFAYNKNTLPSTDISTPITTTVAKPGLTQKAPPANVSGNKGNAIGAINGNGNTTVQEENNKTNSDNTTIINSSYIKDNYTVYYSYNPKTKDTIIIKRVRINTVEEQNEEKNSSCSLNNVTFYMSSMSSSYYVKFYGKKGDTYDFVSYINAVDHHGIATRNGDKIILTDTDSNNQIGKASLSNGCKDLTGYVGSQSFNFSR